MVTSLSQARANQTPYNLAAGNFSQNWTDSSLITTSNDWSGVPSIEGYPGENLSGPNVDPQTITGDVVDAPAVVANGSTVITADSIGGVAEYEGEQTVAIRGGSNADAAQLILYLNTTGRSAVTVSYLLKDIDDVNVNASGYRQPVALQYCVGATGTFTNVPAAFQSTTRRATQVPVNAQLPAAVENQPLVRVRIMTSNITGTDKWIGVDDIAVTSTGGTFSPNAAPTLTAISNPAALPINSGAQAVGLSGISAGAGESQTLTVTAVSSNTALIPNPTVTYTSPNTTGSLSFSPVAGQSGTSQITVTVKDNGGTANGGIDTVSRSFTVTVNPASPLPTLSINDVTVTEGNSGTTSAIFTLTLSAASSQSVTVNCATANNSATSGSDYTATSGMLTILAGSTTKTFTVPVIGDVNAESNETFFVNLSGVSNATLLDAQGVGTIINDDAAPTPTPVPTPTATPKPTATPVPTPVPTATPVPIPSLSIDDVTVTEGNSGTINANFTITLSAPSSEFVTVDFATANNTATGTIDYVSKNNTFLFPIGSTTKTLTVVVKGDVAFEADETFFVNLSNASYATISDAQGVGTIINDDVAPTPTPIPTPQPTAIPTPTPAPALSISDATRTEGNSGTGNALFAVTLASPVSGTVTVNYATSDGTATAGSDYQTTSGSLSFPAGTTARTVTVPIVGDTVLEADENFKVTLSGANIVPITRAQGVGTILNDDSNTRGPNAMAAWGENRYGQFGNNDTASSLVPLAVPNSGALAGKTIKQIGVAGSANTVLCTDGTVAAWGAGSLGNGSTTGSLIPVDITNSGVLNGKTVVQIGPHNGCALCSDGTVAVWGSNIYGRLGNNSTTDSTVPIAINNFGYLQGKTVTQIASVSNFYAAVCSDGTVATWGYNGYGQLGNNTYTNSSIPVAVNTSGALNGKSVIQIDVGTNHCLALCSDGTVVAWGSGGAGRLGNNGETSSKVPVVINGYGDLPGKTVTQVCIGVTTSYAVCSDGTALAWGYNGLGEVGNDTTTDPWVPVAINGFGALQGKKVIQLDGGDGFCVALCSDGTVASWGTNSSGQLGNNSLTRSLIPIDITNSGALKGQHVLHVGAGSSHCNAIIAPEPSISIGVATIAEGNAGTTNATFNVTLDDISRATVTVSYNTSAGTATSGTDYKAVAGTLSFPPGTTTKTIAVPIIGDTVAEPDETFTVNLSSATGATLGTSQGIGTILNDDAESVKPVPVITNPIADQNLLLTSFKSGGIKGTATDNVGVTAVTLKLYRLRNGVNNYWNGTAFTTTSATVPATLISSGSSVSWSIDSLFPPQSQLDIGQYSALVYAFDAAGNVGSTTTRFNLISSDTVAPVTYVNTPNTNQKVLISDFIVGAISGTATDDYGVTSVKVKLSRKRGTNYYWNGTAFTTSAALLAATVTPAGDTFVKWNLDSQMPPAAALDSGLYQLDVYAMDVGGNKSVTIVHPFTLGTDFATPTVDITTPTSGQSLSLSAFTTGTVTGTAADNLGVTSVKLKLQRKRGAVTTYWNGSTFITTAAFVDATVTSVGGTAVTWSFNAKVPTPATGLDAGSYTLYASSFDAAGNTRTTAARGFTLITASSAAPSVVGGSGGKS